MHSGLVNLNSYSQWNTDVYDEISIDDFCCLSDFKNGIYRISSGKVTIDFLLNGFDKIKSDVCLVFFQGAITNRNNTLPPYFTGTGIAEKLGHPFISIADPTISLDDSLTLSWYAGNKDDSLVPYKIARLLDYVANLLGFKLVLIGGSGGGFSVLVQSCILTSKATAIVWNPQTSIENYSSRFVSNYMEVAFDNDWVSFLDTKPKEDLIKHKAVEILRERKILHSILGLNISYNIELLYLQNKDDWHVQSHLKPFLKNREIERISRTSFYLDDNAALHIGDWGKGHTPPPKEVIKDIILQVADSTKSVREIAYNLSFDSHDDFIPLISVDSEFKDFNPSLYFNEGREDLTINVVLPDNFMANENFKCAIYLYRNNERMHVCWYQDEFKFKVKGGGGQGINAVKVFLKDIFGDVLSKFISLK